MSFLDQWLGMHLPLFGDMKLIDAKLQSAQLLWYMGFSDTWYFGVMALQQKSMMGRATGCTVLGHTKRGTGPNRESTCMGPWSVQCGDLIIAQVEGLFCSSHYEMAPLC